MMVKVEQMKNINMTAMGKKKLETSTPIRQRQ